MTYIRVTRNFNEIPILNLNNVVVHLTQVNRYHLASLFAFTADLEIHSIISLLFYETFNTFTNTKIVK